jgi:SSS family solute:Na+ symporter
MSTIDSLVNSCSTVLTIDFYQRLWKPSATEREMIRIGRYTAVEVLILGVMWTPVVGRWETLFGYFQECWFFMAVPIVVVFVSALLWPRSNNFSATATLLLCIPMTLLPAILKWLQVEVNSFVLAGILLIPVVAFHVTTSYMRAAPKQTRVSQWIWKRKMLFLPTEEKTGSNPWYKNLLLWWALVMAAYIAIYIIFW